MTIWPRLRALAYRLRRRAAWERALHDEFQAFRSRDRRPIRRGMPPAAACRTALADFGGVEHVKERVLLACDRRFTTSSGRMQRRPRAPPHAVHDLGRGKSNRHGGDDRRARALNARWSFRSQKSQSRSASFACR
jgi:hypothetical protein